MWQERGGKASQSILHGIATQAHKMTKNMDRAPSWSWASMDGGISFPLDLEYDRLRMRVSDAHFGDLLDTVATHASGPGLDLFSTARQHRKCWRA